MRRGFTLVELMITVAIIAILAAVAIPVLANMQLRARFAEVGLNVDGIGKSAGEYMRTETACAYGASRGSTAVGKAIYTWTGFPTIGYTPDGGVRCFYNFQADPRFTGVPNSGIGVVCDLDADGTQWFTAVFPGGALQEGSGCANSTSSAVVCGGAPSMPDPITAGSSAAGPCY